MFALKSGLGGNSRRNNGLHAGFVFPRVLRRPARTLSRLFAGVYQPPRYAGLVLGAAFFAATGIYGTILGGHGPAVVSAITARSGFAVSDVRVSGNRETSEIDVLGQLDLTGYTSLISLDANKVRRDVEALPWVKSASVRKVYPSAIEISIQEHNPFAIWQHGDALSMVQADGTTIAPFRDSRNAGLPLVIGNGAPAKAAAFITEVEQFPSLAKRVTAYILVAGRRWDLRLDNDVTIKLPEKDYDAALGEIAALDQEQMLLSRGVVAVDMRLADRMTLQLLPDEAELFRASMRDRLGMSKKYGRRT